MWAGDASPGAYSTSTPFMLLPGTLGRAWSKTTLIFASWSAAMAERRPRAATMSTQTISVNRSSPVGFEAWIRFIVTLFSVRWLVATHQAKALLLQRHKHRRKTSLYLADDRIAECKFQNIPGPVAKDHKAARNASRYSIL